MLYVKAKWPEDRIPAGEPEWLHYEVAEDTDVVWRSVEVYPDGRAIRLGGEGAEGDDQDARTAIRRSLVHGDFLNDPEIRRHLAASTRDEFERLWTLASDAPR